ncbi:chemotaxis protein CheW [Anaeromicropila populeti]|uniref:Purine-binding chemotaxis protein CheW n=1 Tax=Anaeromicropila populeti TaxID=37658 RepID=A0A1I6J346_9FIRM|nr:chemotaxis protein CheW [Anaeromicropila populeti]SFR73442.1 purine-binding chemotaxis protein CheW [Anaeromicropila populeti]
MAAIKHILFLIGKETYGVEVQYIKGIEKYEEFISIPNAPSYIEGIINLRGEVIPVFSLRQKFNMPKVEPTENTKLIIVKTGGIVIGLEVDAVKEIAEIAEEAIREAPFIIKGDKTKYIQSIANVEDGLCVILNIDGLLDEQEKADLEGLINQQ